MTKKKKNNKAFGFDDYVDIVKKDLKARSKREDKILLAFDGLSKSQTNLVLKLAEEFQKAPQVVYAERPKIDGRGDPAL